MLSSYPFIAFVATHNPDLAKAFYSGTLGLRLVREDEDTLVFEAHGVRLHVTIVQDLVTVKYSVLGWEVPDIVAEVKELQKAGVKFVRLEVSKQQDELGIWTSPKGDRVAWFKDPDDNVLSIKQMKAA
jgi:catechol 2,3-dioxygenase-like lactoylglutathione lyase family enzyme